MNRPQSDSESAPATTEHVIDVALVSFAEKGFADTKLESIASESGMTKRMIHYHFGDKRGLYLQALARAVQLLRPVQEKLEPSSSVPVDGVQQAVEALFDQVIEHPEVCRLIVMENLFRWADLGQVSPLADQSSVILSLDRLLMLGQDAGAFRPGISALDVYTIIASMCSFRISNRDTFVNLYSTDLGDASNTDGMKKLTVDTVLSFLTSNMSSTGVSYLKPDNPSTLHDHAEETSMSSGIYSDEPITDGDIMGSLSDIFED